MTKIEAVMHLVEALLAGFFGALVSLIFHPDTKALTARCVLVASGTVTAYYVGPLVIGFLKISPSLGSGVSFLVGAFGMSLAAAIMRAIRIADLWALVSAHLGGNKE